MAAPFSSFKFFINAVLTAGSFSASLSGSYASDGSWEISATVEDVGTDGIIELYNHITGGTLEVPAHANLVVGDGTIVVNNHGLTVIAAVKVDGYISDEASLSFTSSGLVIDAEIPDQDLDDVTLQKAHLHISLEKQGSPKSMDISLSGQITFLGLQISAAVHLYKDAASSETFDWTIYGRFTTYDQGIPIGDLIKEVCDASAPKFLNDLTLDKALLVVASKDDPSLSSLNPQGYTIHAGN